MKRATRKLVVRSETLRVLRALTSVELGHAEGGNARIVADGESHADCPIAAAFVADQKLS